MRCLSRSLNSITYFLIVLLFNMTVVLASWLLQMAEILLNFRFNFKYYLLNAYHISYIVFTTLTYIFIFKGPVLTSNFSSTLALTTAMILADFVLLLQYCLVFLTQHSYVTKLYIGCNFPQSPIFLVCSTSTLKAKSFLFGPFAPQY